MGLEKLKEELKEKIAEAEKAEAVVEEVVEEKPIEEEKKDEPKPEEAKVEEVKEEEKPKKTPAEYAEERRQAKASRLADELATANARIAALEAQRPAQKEEVAADPEPSIDDAIAHLAWQLRQTNKKLDNAESELKKVDNWKSEEERKRNQEINRNAALEEVAVLEASVRAEHPDYDGAKAFLANLYAGMIMVDEPNLSGDKLGKAVADKMLARAARLARSGHDNAIEVMYNDAVKFGYKPSANDDAKEEAKEVKPDMAKVAANRARNAGTAAAQGDGGKGDLTPKFAATLTNAEFAKLKPAEKERMFRQLGATG